MDQQTIDSLTATRIVHLLITPYSQWDAFKDGVIDASGNVLRSPKYSESKNFNLLHKLVIKLRAMFSITPGSSKFIQAWNAGDKFFGQNMAAANFTSWKVSNKALLPSAAAAYHVVKEAVETSKCGTYLNVICESTQFDSLLDHVSVKDILMFEEAGTSAGGGAFASLPPNDPVVTPTAASKYKKRNKKNGPKPIDTES